VSLKFVPIYENNRTTIIPSSGGRIDVESPAYDYNSKLVFSGRKTAKPFSVSPGPSGVEKPSMKFRIALKSEEEGNNILKLKTVSPQPPPPVDLNPTDGQFKPIR